MPRVVTPTTVVEIPGQLKINEFGGGASDGQAGVSVAHVQAKAGFAEDWQTPEFDEWVVVLKGSVKVEHSHGDPIVASAGQGLFLAKGERVRWVFEEDAEYVPVCLPAFSPANVHREEPGHDVPPPPHDAHKDIYHLVQEPIWEVTNPHPPFY